MEIFHYKYGTLIYYWYGIHLYSKYGHFALQIWHCEILPVCKSFIFQIWSFFITMVFPLFKKFWVTFHLCQNLYSTYVYCWCYSLWALFPKKLFIRYYCWRGFFKKSKNNVELFLLMLIFLMINWACRRKYLRLVDVNIFDVNTLPLILCLFYFVFQQNLLKETEYSLPSHFSRSDANDIGLAPRDDKQRRRPSALEVPSLKRGRRSSDQPLTDPTDSVLVTVSLNLSIQFHQF